MPGDLIQFVAGLAASTARSDVKKAICTARLHWQAEQFPDVSLDTWRRRIRCLDPRRALRDLNHSVSRFRGRHSPDIATDYSALHFNDLWQIDDWTEDFDYPADYDLWLHRRYTARKPREYSPIDPFDEPD
jgi:hypothetical protein